MHDAGLHPCLEEDGGDRLREAGEAVDAGDQHVGDAAAVEVVEDGQPELRALGVLPPDPQGFAVAVDGEIAGAGADRAVFSDPDVHRVEVDDRVDPLKWPRAPRGDVLEHRVGDAADRVAANLDAVEPLQVRGDVAHAHAAGVEVEHPVIQARQPGLALAHQLRLERPRAVARRAQPDRPEVGADRLGGRAVTDVAGGACPGG